MSEPVEFLALNQELYSEFYEKTKALDFGLMLLPAHYNQKLWGLIICKAEIVIGGWVGHLRGDILIARIFTKAIWFNSLPVFFEQNVKEALLCKFLDYAKCQAKSEGIVLFNVTHWSRQTLADSFIFNIQSCNASIILDLKKNKETLWKEVDSKMRNIIRKGEKKEVNVFVTHGEASMPYLDIFQELRKNTHHRAIKKNSRISMLLKSRHFFAEILQNCQSYFFIAQYKQEIVAMACMIQSGRTMSYFSGGSDLEANKKSGASSFLIWNAIMFAKEAKMKFFDMGGVPLEPVGDNPALGVYHFKKSFGGEYKEFNSGKIVTNPLKFKILNLVLNNRFILRLLSKA